MRNVLPAQTENVIEAFYVIDAEDKCHLHVITDLPRPSKDDPRFGALKGACDEFLKARHNRLVATARGRSIDGAVIHSVTYESAR